MFNDDTVRALALCNCGLRFCSSCGAGAAAAHRARVRTALANNARRAERQELRAQRLADERARGRAHHFGLCELRRCACGADFLVMSTAPKTATCSSCSTPTQRPRVEVTPAVAACDEVEQ
jgi:hypothetical protein